jgi:hypothetical protein
MFRATRACSYRVIAFALTSLSVLATGLPTGVAHANSASATPPPSVVAAAVLSPDSLIDQYAATHAWLGGKVGNLQLGPPTGDFQYFTSGVVYDYLGQVHEVHGAIEDEYYQVSGPFSVLGYPITDQTTTPDGSGAYNRFQTGSIYWSAWTGAHEVHGPIRDEWAALGSEAAWVIPQAIS